MRICPLLRVRNEGHVPNVEDRARLRVPQPPRRRTPIHCEGSAPRELCSHAGFVNAKAMPNTTTGACALRSASEHSREQSVSRDPDPGAVAGDSLTPVYFIVLDIRDRSTRKLTIERFSIGDATAEELWPGRHGDVRIDRFRQQTPELWMMPAEIVAGVVPMRPDASPKSLHFGDEHLAVKTLQVLIHRRTSKIVPRIRRPYAERSPPVDRGTPADSRHTCPRSCEVRTSDIGTGGPFADPLNPALPQQTTDLRPSRHPRLPRRTGRPSVRCALVRHRPQG